MPAALIPGVDEFPGEVVTSIVNIYLGYSALKNYKKTLDFQYALADEQMMLAEELLAKQCGFRECDAEILAQAGGGIKLEFCMEDVQRAAMDARRQASNYRRKGMRGFDCYSSGAKRAFNREVTIASSHAAVGSMLQAWQAEWQKEDACKSSQVDQLADSLNTRTNLSYLDQGFGITGSIYSGLADSYADTVNGSLLAGAYYASAAIDRYSPPPARGSVQMSDHHPDTVYPPRYNDSANGWDGWDLSGGNRQYGVAIPGINPLESQPLGQATSYYYSDPF